jgi:hypothetical protein
MAALIAGSLMSGLASANKTEEPKNETAKMAELNNHRFVISISRMFMTRTMTDITKIVPQMILYKYWCDYDEGSG